MEWRRHRQKFFWGVVTVLLGAVGSGLWEFALRPCFSWLASFCIDGLLSISSGFTTAVYVDIAKGQADRIDKAILGYGTGAVLGLGGIGLKTWAREKGPTPKRKASKVLFPLTVFVCSVVLFGFFLTLFMTNRINDFEQLVSITAPYLDDAQLKKVKSEFGQIHRRDDYEKLMRELRGVAHSNGAYLPDHLKHDR